MTAKRTPSSGKIGRGRPTSYRPEYCALVKDYCLLGATVLELAELLEVTDTTIKDWMRRHPEFKEAIHAGRAKADARVARALYRRAIGYRHEDTHIAVMRTGGGVDADGVPIPAQAEVIRTPLVKHYPPDTAAAFIWLQNRRPQDWRREQPEGTGTTAADIAAEAQALIQRAMATSAPESSE